MKSVVEGRKTIHELFVEAGQIDRLFTGTTPTDLFRFSETNGPLSDKMLMYPFLEEQFLANGRNRSADFERREIPSGSGIFYIIPNIKRGLSLFSGPGKFKNPGTHHVVPTGTTIPPGLAVSRDNFNERMGHTHYSVHTVQMIHDMHFLFLLRRFASFAIPMNAWKVLYPERAAALNL